MKYDNLQLTNHVVSCRDKPLDTLKSVHAEVYAKELDNRVYRNLQCNILQYLKWLKFNSVKNNMKFLLQLRVCCHFFSIIVYLFTFVLCRLNLFRVDFNLFTSLVRLKKTIRRCIVRCWCTGGLRHMFWFRWFINTLMM